MGRRRRRITVLELIVAKRVLQIFVVETGLELDLELVLGLGACGLAFVWQGGEVLYPE